MFRLCRFPVCGLRYFLETAVTDKEHIWRLRDAALRVLHARAHWETLGGLRVVVADWASTKITYRTPFQRGLRAPETLTYASAQALANADRDLPYVIEIWSLQEAPPQWFQVLHVQWSDNDAERRVVAFTEGAWEAPLLQLWLTLSGTTLPALDCQAARDTLKAFPG